MRKRNSIQLLCLVILCGTLLFTSSCGARPSAESTEMISSIYISMDIPTANSVADMARWLILSWQVNMWKKWKVTTRTGIRKIPQRRLLAHSILAGFIVFVCRRYSKVKEWRNL